MPDKIITKSKIFLFFCLSFIAGVFLNSFIEVGLPLVAGFLILGIILVSCLWKYKKAVVFGFCLLFLVFGFWRYQIEENKINSSKFLNYSGKSIILEGFISSDPAVKEKSCVFDFTAEKIIRKDGFNEETKEKILVTTAKYPEYSYGEKLIINGEIKKPEAFEGFDYQEYLKKERISFIMVWPEVEKGNGNKGNLLLGAIFSFKNRFQEITRQFIPSPEQGILEALAFGDENNIPKALKDKLNLTGTRHITAVSGMNITIIASMILSLLLSLGFWRKKAFLASLFLIFLYILMVGAPASAVRAGLMAGLLMLAQYFGRLYAAPRAIVFAAALMIFLNPFVLRYDIGFQLSFLAILGMVYFSSFFSGLLKFVPEIFSARSVISMTLSAQVLTFPILIYNFGRMPLVSSLSNILIVPLLGPVTVLILIFGAVAMVFSFLGTVLSWPVWFSLAYIIAIIDLFAKIPFSSISFRFHWVFLVLIYLVLGYLAFRVKEKEKLKFLDY